MINKIITDNAPAPRGHYSHAVAWNGLIFLSGQLPIDAEGIPRADLSVEEQARLVFHNLKQVLADSGSSLDPVSYTHLDVYKRQLLPGLQLQ